MICNLTKSSVVAERPEWAESFGARLFGRMMRRFQKGKCDALVFDRCNMVHTFFMIEKIDIVMLAEDFKVVYISRDTPVFRPYIGCREASITLELPRGRAAASATEVGDVLNLNMLEHTELKDENILCQWS